MSFWDLDNDTGQGDPALAAAFDVSVTSSFDPPQTVFRWDTSHPIFNSPNAVGDLTSFSNQWADDGDRLRMVPL